MNFIIKALNHDQFEHLNGLSDDALKAIGVVPYTADDAGFPCRVTLEDAELGGRVFLLNYTHLDSDNPYRSSHAIFVREGVKERRLPINEVPKYILKRQVSIRSFDQDDMMIDGEAIAGEKAKACIEKMLTNSNVKYLHVHSASRGCYMACVVRA